MRLDELAKTSTESLLNTTAARFDPAAGQDALRRTVRRRRVASMALVAAGAAAVVVFGSLVLVQPTPQSEPAGPPAQGPGLTSPLVAPTSLQQLHALGFHVAPLPGFDPRGLGAGWAIDPEGQSLTLRWDEVADVVHVEVRYQGAPAPDPSQTFAQWTNPTDVTIHGAVGHYYDQFNIYGIGGSFRALLTWEYAPNSWASVSAYSDRMSPGPERLQTALVQVANAVQPDGEPVRIPLRIAALPPSMPAASNASGVSLTFGLDGWEPAVNYGPHLTFTGVRGAVPQACRGYDGGGVETFTYNGQDGCLNGYGTPDTAGTGSVYSNFNAVSLQSGDLIRTVQVVRGEDGSAPEYPLADLKQAVARTTMADLNNQSTWFDLTTALGGSGAGTSG